MKITETDIGPAIILNRRLTRLEEEDIASAGSIALCLLLDSKRIPQCYALVWQWGGDWTGFGDDEREDINALSGWMPNAIREAVAAAVEWLPACADDLDWFLEWADDAEQTMLAVDEAMSKDD